MIERQVVTLVEVAAAIPRLAAAARRCRGWSNGPGWILLGWLDVRSG
jgi:hypothetical protein